MQSTETLLSSPAAANAIEALLPSRRRLRGRFYLALGLTDIGAVIPGFAILGFRHPSEPFLDAATRLPVLLVLFIGLSLGTRAFSAKTLSVWWRGLPALLVAFVAAAATTMVLARSWPSLLPSAAPLLASIVLLIIGRALVGQASARAFASHPLARVLLTDGVPAPCPIDIRTIKFTPHALAPSADPFALGRFARLLQDVDRIYVSTVPGRRAAWATALRRINVHGEILLPELDAIGTVGGTRIAGVATMLVSVGPLGLRQRLIKRTFDLALSAVLLALLAPLLLIVAVAVRIDSPGPVLARQLRMGSSNRPFHIFRFRSVHDWPDSVIGPWTIASEGSHLSKIPRATGINELPQLLNIPLGAMSFVGPRACDAIP